MQFSDHPDDNYFFSQPHQPFFVLAFVNAVVLMLIFMLSYKGIINMAISSATFHSYGLTFLLFTPAFLAFLFTTFPRFASTPNIETKVYMRVFSFFYLGSTLFILGSIVSPIFSALGMMLPFIGHILGTLILKNIYTTTKMEDTHDIFWIYTAMRFGIFAHFLFIMGELFYTPVIGLATEIAVYLYLFLLTFSVAQRMVPFFSHSMEGRNDYLLKVSFVLLLLHVVFEGIYTNSSFLVDILLGILIGKEILRWKFQFPNPNPLLWVLHSGTLLDTSCLHPWRSDQSCHATERYILFSPRYTHDNPRLHIYHSHWFWYPCDTGHSGNMMQADKWTQYLFYATQAVVVLRILVSLLAAFDWNFMILFDITATVWMLILIAWAVRFFPVLIKGKKLTK